MGVYHITHTPELNEICLYFNAGCNFSCHGCITNYHPEDCHLEESISQSEYKSINIDEVIAYLKPLSFNRVIFLGKEPTEDADFLPLAKILKEHFSTYNILLTNGYKFAADKALDEVCVSIKAISRELFKDFTGRDDPERVLKYFKRYVNSFALRVRAESIFIPGYIDIDEIEKIIQFIARVDSSIPYRIDAYIPYAKEDRFRRPTKMEMEQVQKIAKEYLKNVSILHYGVNVKYKVETIY
jgi:pyruvate-formate lyase-activating enzyme